MKTQPALLVVLGLLAIPAMAHAAGRLPPGSVPPPQVIVDSSDLAAFRIEWAHAARRSGRLWLSGRVSRNPSSPPGRCFVEARDRAGNLLGAVPCHPFPIRGGPVTDFSGTVAAGRDAQEIVVRALQGWGTGT
ncbi:hypothetical protein OLX02_03530 [Novosphingobium sp. KCTC 2891]|uniref:hypothetical protein n=1 Tax=Novosphingobium sp. KCTC 2891 TaxID=2989730 RepID=UPI00222184E6|nr:hypothetical protein [Novosphingobium sp. KCTC 2891]MCW1381887.1 hypothetical protein [Novosphingobium sp. KCTC 2891]